MEDPRIISALFIFLKMAYYNVLINKKEEVFSFWDEDEFVVKIKSKKIQNAYIHTLFSKRNKTFTFEDAKKKLPLDEFVEYLREQDQKIF